MYSLYPSYQNYPGRDRFHNYPVTGRRTLDGAQAQALASELLHDVVRRIEKPLFGCFKPRHGLRCSGYDFVICFECNLILAGAKD